MDFDSRYRGDMIKYAAQRYGWDHVAQIVTFSTIKARAAVRDGARVLGYPYVVGDKIAKLMPPLVMGRDTPLHACLDPHPKYTDGYKMAGELRELYATDPDAKRVIDVARGLDHAHRLRNADGDPLGVVHRDVSPHNVFVCSSGVAKIFDFGIAKSKEQQHATSPGGMKGKLHYLAPEQLHGHAPDARFDVFALGIVLHEVLTGEPLFHGENDAETLHALLTRYVPPPELMRGDVPSGLGAIVLRALQREPDRRLPTAGAMADALEAVAEAEGIELSTSAVRGFMAALFPNDRALDAQRLDAAKRVYDAVVPVAPALVPLALPRRTPRRRSGWARAAVVLGAMSFAVFAAASAAHFLAPRPSTPVVEAVAAPPVRAAPVAASVVAELEGTSSLLREPSDPSGLPARKPASPLKRRFHVSDGCSVYISITKGGPTMVCPKGSTKRARR